MHAEIESRGVVAPLTCTKLLHFQGPILSLLVLLGHGQLLAPTCCPVRSPRLGCLSALVVLCHIFSPVYDAIYRILFFIFYSADVVSESVVH